MIIEMPAPREITCESCGEVFSAPWGLHCAQCADRDRRNEVRAEIAARLRSFVASLPDWPRARFDDDWFSDRTSKAPNIVGASQTWHHGAGNLILSGSSGRGKTLSSVALAHRLVDTAMVGMPHDPPVAFAAGAFFLSAPTLVAEARKFASRPAKAPLFGRACTATLLILDEIGFEPRHACVFELIDVRYRLGARRNPTIVTTGLGLGDLRARYGDAWTRRLLDCGAFVFDDGEEL